MNPNRIRWLNIISLCGLVAACTEAKDPAPHPTPHGDADRPSEDGANADLAAADYDVGDSGPLVEFPLRVPGSHLMLCGGEEEWVPDVDYVCQIATGGLALELYVQASPTNCDETQMFAPQMVAIGAWLKLDGQVWPTPARYNWGGNHHNDSVNFAVDSAIYTLYHSSFSFGWRKCAPPDCLLTCDASATMNAPCDNWAKLAVDGCARDSGDGPPPNPVICVEVDPSGSVPPFLDPWSSQAGNAEYPRLPCIGDI